MSTLADMLTESSVMPPANTASRHLRMVAAATQLSRILAEDLPDLNWSIPAHAPGTLVGSIDAPQDVAAELVSPIIARYAEYLAANSITKTSTCDEERHFRVRVIHVEGVIAGDVRVSLYGTIHPPAEAEQ